MKKALARALLAGLFAIAMLFQVPLLATDLTGTFNKPDGTPVTGKLIFLLSQPARLSDNSAQVVPTVKIFSVTNGQLESGAFIYGNDVLVPTGTHYLVRLVDDNNNLLFEQKWSIQGATLDLGTLTPTTTGVVLPDPLVKNVTTDQAVQGPVTFNSGVTALSLTLNGSLNPGATDAFDLGTAAARWREIHTQRVGGWVLPGTVSGLVTPPSASPIITNSATGGTIAAGTYYIKLTYLTCSNAACTTFGETPPSPSQSVVTTGTTSRLQVPVSATTDVQWRSGAVAYFVYASSDNINFFRQTLNPVNGNQACQLDTQAHIVNCGSGAVLTSLTFSGAQPPTTNTAAISPLQAALNSVSTFSNPNQIAAIVVSNASQTLNTPLVISQYQQLDCTAHMNAQSTSSGLISSAITHPKLATVMITGTATVEGCDIRNTAGNALLLQSVVSGGNSVRMANGSIRSTATSGGYDAVRIVGVWYDLVFENNYIASADRANVHLVGVSGGDWVFSGRRWDVGDHAFWNESTKSDPDLDSDYSGQFPNGVNNVVFREVLFESGDKEWFHAVNTTFKVYSCEFADPSTDAGTSSMFLIGTDSNNSTGNMQDIAIYGSFMQNNNNFGAAFKVESNANAAFQRVMVTSTSLSSTNYVDFNNVSTAPHFVFIGTQARPYEGATSRRFINMPAGKFPTVIGTPNDGTTEAQRGMNAFQGSVIFADQNNNANRRTAHWRSTNIFSLYEGDPATLSNLAFDWDANDLRFYKSDGSTHLLHLNRNSASGNTIGIGRTAPASGIIGLPNNEALVARNAANGAEVSLLKLNASDQLELGTAASGFPKFMASTGNVPFSVNAGTSKVTDLDSDKWDGKDGLDFSATLDFASIAGQACAELSATATGAAAGNPIASSWPAGLEAGLVGNMRVSSANTVMVRLCNITASAIDPVSQTFGGRIIK